MSITLLARALLHALSMSAGMAWLLAWPLILGFAVSAVVQALVSHEEIARLLPDARPCTVARAAALGAASSSCSYAAVAIARSLFRKGADFRAAMAFQFASTNLVIELGLVLGVLMGWTFTAAAWAGGVIMIGVLTLLMRLAIPRRMIEAARVQADRNLPGRMEGHAAMDMTAPRGPFLKRLLSPAGFTAVSHVFVMEWASLWFDILLGLVISGALAAWVPPHVWASLFLVHDPAAQRIVGPLVGPLIAMISFVCSVGAVPLAAVLWNGGASFGAVVAFIFGDLIILPILDIYRRYYGLRMTGVLLMVFYAAMVVAGWAVEFGFGAMGLVPAVHHAQVGEATISWNYTTWLNIALGLLAGLLAWRFLRTGGPAMLEMMSPLQAREDGHVHHHRA